MTTILNWSFESKKMVPPSPISVFVHTGTTQQKKLRSYKLPHLRIQYVKRLCAIRAISSTKVSSYFFYRMYNQYHWYIYLPSEVQSDISSTINTQQYVVLKPQVHNMNTLKHELLNLPQPEGKLKKNSKKKHKQEIVLT